MFRIKKSGFQDPTKNIQCTEFEVNNWIVSEFVIDCLVPVVGWHPFPLNELMLMTSAVCRFKPEYVFEWGTNIGKSARVFYEIVSAFKINCQIHSIDLPDNEFHAEHPQKNRGKMVRGKKNVFLHQGDGLLKSFEILKNINPHVTILFFLDGDHSFETVKNELFQIEERFPNAIVLLHDTLFQSELSGYNIGPFKAIKEVINSEKYNILSTGFGLPGMSLVYRKVF